MLYDATGREIPEQAGRPVERQLTRWEPSDRFQTDPSVGMTPESLASVLNQAAQGDPQNQALLARSIIEKDWDVQAAIGVRCAAVEGTDFDVVTPDGLEEDTSAKGIADAAKRMLAACIGGKGLMGFHEWIGHKMGALLPGYACAEILWRNGGAQIAGFAPIASDAITFRDSQEPLIDTRSAGPLPLLPNKFTFHRHRAASGDATRGGLIRPLGWMFMFRMFGVKNMLRLVEKVGMPFVAAKVDENDYDKTRAELAYLIRNFGSDGGGVFTKAVEIELLEAANADGAIQFKLLEYFKSATQVVVLGQLASSGEGGGLSLGTAQDNVRQDLLESDCRQIARTVRQDILQPWVMFNYGADAPVPEFKFRLEEEADLDAKAKIFETLSRTGWRVRQRVVEKEFGVEVEPVPATSSPFAPMEDRTPEAARRSRLKLQQDARGAADRIVTEALDECRRDTTIATTWLAPLMDAVEEAFAGLPKEAGPEQTAAALKRLRSLLADGGKVFGKMDTAKLEDLLSRAAFAADTNGRIASAEALN